MRRFGRALVRRCPRCGGGDIFDGWWSLRERCPRCGLHYEREEGYWLGAVALNTGAAIVAFALAFGGSIAATWPDPSWRLVTTVTLVVALAVPIVFYPLSKTLWVAVDLALRGE